MTSVFWDTNLFIYLIEQDPQFHAHVVALRRRMLAKGARLVTSSLALGEVLVKPIREGRQDLVDQYRAILTSPAVHMVHFDERVAEHWAAIRAGDTKKEIRPQDAIHLACAGTFGVDFFVTNDNRLSKVRVDGVGQVLSLASAGNAP